MPVRITQMMKFTNFVNNMNFSLDKLMSLNEQASSQKKVNRPSDSPVAAGQILQYRNSLASIDQYSRNTDIAKGWLSMADSTLTQVSTVLSRVRELAEQAATGTMSKDNREQVSYEVRQLFEQLIVLSNTEYEEQQIFAGQKTSGQAFNEHMAVTTNDPDATPNYKVQGLSETTVVTQFLDSGTVGTDELRYRYSSDGGDTWTEGTLASNANILNLGGVQVTLMDKDDGSAPVVSAVDTDSVHSVDNDGNNNGTWLWVRPTALYQGDFEDSIEVDNLGGSATGAPSDPNATAQGFFRQDVMVRIDEAVAGGEVDYSYSLDRGITWVEDNTVSNSSPLELLVPGGHLTVSSAAAGHQYNIRPERANIFYEISPGEEISVNNIGKDVFGGVYFESPCASNCTTALGGTPDNMFETVGELLGYIETNDQAGIQRGLANLDEAMEHVLTAAANVGARENRLEITVSVLDSLHLNKSERLSEIEDADVSELMTQLAQQQIVYESVLKSSSMIMRMSLVNYV